MDNAWLSVLPPVITIAAAILSKKVLPSLFLGLLVGSYLLSPSPLGGLETAIEKIIATLSDKNNLQVLLFLYLFGGLIALVRRSGGIDAFSNLLSKYVRSEKGVLYTLWALIPVTFIDCAYRIFGAGAIIRPLAEKNNVAKERIAFVLNNTASPLIQLIPIATTFVGFNIANIGQGLKAAGVSESQSPYRVLLHAIPFEFFSFAVLLITFLTIFFQWKISSSNNQTQTLREATAGGMKMNMESQKPEIKPRIINLIVPMSSVIFFSFFFFWYFGKTKDGVAETLSSIIAATDPNKAMLVALFISIFITGSIYFFQKYKLNKMTDDMISGGNELMSILAILIVAWSLGTVSLDLNLSGFIKQQLSNSMPVWSIPVSIFLISSAVTYFIGESWAAASLIMPFAISLAVASGTGIPICVAAVITGGTFGDVSSPVAGMTNMASIVAGADHMKYLKYANPYNFLAMALAALCFLLFGYIG